MSSTLYVKYIIRKVRLTHDSGIQFRLVSHVKSGQDWAKSGKVCGRVDTGHSAQWRADIGGTLDTLSSRDTKQRERCQPETLDTVFQGSQKAAKEALVFSPLYMRVSHIVNDKSINEVREIFAGNRMLELFLSGAIVRGWKIGEMGWVVKWDLWEMHNCTSAQLHNCTLVHLYTFTLVHWLTALAFFLPRELLQKGVRDICTDAMCKMDGTWVLKLGEVCMHLVRFPN